MIRCSGVEDISASEPMRIPLHRIRLPRSIPAGMNLIRIAAIADTLSTGGEIWDPVVVRRDPGKRRWSVVDGRHRYMASYVAGVPDLLCIEEP